MIALQLLNWQFQQLNYILPFVTLFIKKILKSETVFPINEDWFVLFVCGSTMF
jgi:hypothetical protein